MGREVRRVPASWEHPKVWQHGQHGFKPLFGGSFGQRLAEWDEEEAQWQAGYMRSFRPEGQRWMPKDPEYAETPFDEWSGPRPKAEDYMPDWPEAERTHWQMYEDCSEGTPISPVMESPEKLARWLADNGASSFGSTTASYEAWLAVCRGAYAPSAVYSQATGLISGVEAVKKEGDD